MGYWQEEHNANSKLFVKLLGAKSDEKELYFEVWKDKTKANYIEWVLKGVWLWSYDYQWKPRETIVLSIADWDVELEFSIAFNKIGRAILNKLATAEAFGKIKLKARSYEEDGKLKKWITITNNGVKLEGKHDWEKQKTLSRAVIDPETQEFIRYDYSKLDELLKSELEGINTKILLTDDLPF